MKPGQYATAAIGRLRSNYCADLPAPCFVEYSQEGSTVVMSRNDMMSDSQCNQEMETIPLIYIAKVERNSDGMRPKK
jgi:hypothetical protein